MSKLREKIAEHIEKKLNKTQRIAYSFRDVGYIENEPGTFLELADAIIPMVKTEINKQKPASKPDSKKPEAMGVDFDGFRRQTVWSYNRIVDELNKQIVEGNVQFESIEIQEHMDDLRDCLVTLICLMREGEFEYLPMTIAQFNPESEDNY